jgi:thiamine-monophosphate kinase
VDAALSGLSDHDRLRLALSGGDDYELLFAAPQSRRTDLQRLSDRLDIPLTRIGRFETGRGRAIVDSSGRELGTTLGGYDHFG